MREGDVLIACDSAEEILVAGTDDARSSGASINNQVAGDVIESSLIW